MFQIPPNKLFDANALYMEEIHSNQPEPGNTSIISNAERVAILQQIDNSIANEHFNFSINLLTQDISHCKGLDYWLGYNNNHFSAKTYLRIIHPAHAVVKGVYAIALLEFLSKEKLSLAVLKELTYVSLLALKHKTGQYYYCKKESRALQLTQQGKILEYSNDFTILKEFTSEHFTFRVYDNAGYRTDLEDKILQYVKINFEKWTGFSVQELRILKRYATAENNTSETVANSFKIKKSTVSTYNKRILTKAESILGFRFNDAQTVAEYFKGMRLI